MKPRRSLLGFVIALASGLVTRADTVALWLFDEQVGIYPSSVLNDAGPASHFLILGRGGELVPGKFGRALRPMVPAPLTITSPGAGGAADAASAGSAVRFGLKPPPRQPGRSQAPLTWENAHFAALTTTGDGHLRRAPLDNVTDSRLNVGSSDWTIECWLKLDTATAEEGTIFEIGAGPRGENEWVTRLSVSARDHGFALTCLAAVPTVAPGPAARLIEFPDPAGPPHGTAQLETVTLALPEGTLSREDWFHVALVYTAAEGELRLFAQGKVQSVARVKMIALPRGEEAYVSVGRDGRWGRPLMGAIDELRVSDTAVYSNDFTPPASFSRMPGAVRPPPLAGPPRLFGSLAQTPVIALGSRRHLFLDDALIASRDAITFTSHPARIAERVVAGGGGISVVDAGPEDIRLYLEGPQNSLAVLVSKDGVNFSAPDLGRGAFRGQRNIVITDPASVGTVFLYQNGPAEERWKVVSGLRQRGGVFVYTSADGFRWRRHETVSLPFWVGSAVNVFYDDQRRRYVIHNRTDYHRMRGGSPDRKSVLTEVDDLLAPWPFSPVTAELTRAATARGVLTPADQVDPWWLDNGPLAPGGGGLEYPGAFAADPNIDPAGTDIYDARAQKYPWASDAYGAFPLFFFPYPREGPPQRRVLADLSAERGSGLLETSLAVSRDGLAWHRYSRPAGVGIGDADGYPVRHSYVGSGFVRRGAQIWQYAGSCSSYHDGYNKKPPAPDGIHRLVQRVDGFVSADAPAGGGTFTTKPLRFSGNRLLVNVDTDAAGYAQIGLVDASGGTIPGFGLDDCVNVHGDDINYEVAWLPAGGKPTKDLAALAGRTVRLVVRMRRTSLYALQFVTAGL